MILEMIFDLDGDLQNTTNFKRFLDATIKEIVKEIPEGARFQALFNHLEGDGDGPIHERLLTEARCKVDDQAIMFRAKVSLDKFDRTRYTGADGRDVVTTERDVTMIRKAAQ